MVCLFLKFEGKSWRLKEAASRVAKNAQRTKVQRVSFTGPPEGLGWPRVGEFEVAIGDEACHRHGHVRHGEVSVLLYCGMTKLLSVSLPERALGLA